MVFIQREICKSVNDHGHFYSRLIGMGFVSQNFEHRQRLDDGHEPAHKHHLDIVVLFHCFSHGCSSVSRLLDMLDPCEDVANADCCGSGKFWDCSVGLLFITFLIVGRYIICRRQLVMFRPRASRSTLTLTRGGRGVGFDVACWGRQVVMWRDAAECAC